MKWFLCAWLLCLPACLVASDLPAYDEIDQPPHNYWTRPLKDKFTQLKDDLESGRLPLDRSSELQFVKSLLKALDVPESTQSLVFSTTSLQLSLIGPASPRALYFTEDLYVGYVPRGKIEIVSLDPEVGGIYYIFDIPRRPEAPLRVERSDRCMNCHARADTRFVPGLVLKSVIPGPNRGTLKSYRQEESGHAIPYDQRFGGWYVTGKHSITGHKGNQTGQLSPEGLKTFPIQPGALFQFSRYPEPRSDILPQLVMEHQTGFVNRVIEAGYRARTYLHASGGTLTPEQGGELDSQADQLVRYLLFAEEATMPRGGVVGDGSFKADFLRNRRAASSGASLKDFDLKTRLFKYRCSYMIYSAVYQGLPQEMKSRVHDRLSKALSTASPDPQYAYLPATEKQAIHQILKETLEGLPTGW